MKDRFGVEIVPGAVITYPNRQFSAMWMVTAIVSEIVGDTLEVMAPREQMIYDRDTEIHFWKKSLKPTKVTVIDRVTVLPHVSVASVREEMNEYNQAQLTKFESRVKDKTKAA